MTNLEKKKERKLVAQLCLTLCDPMDCSLPSSSVHGVLQARVLEWVAISFSRGSSRPRLEADALTSEPPGKVGMKKCCRLVDIFCNYNLITLACHFLLH